MRSLVSIASGDSKIIIPIRSHVKSKSNYGSHLGFSIDLQKKEHFKGPFTRKNCGKLNSNLSSVFRKKEVLSAKSFEPVDRK